MTKVKLQGNPVKISGDLPADGKKAPNFQLVKTDLSEVSLENYRDKKVILNIFPSVDTGVCAASVRKFNEKAADLDNTVVLCISQDLPFAQARFCGAEGLEQVEMLSTYRESQFGADYGVMIEEGAFRGLLARAVVVLDQEGKVKYSELVPEIGQEPDYEKALANI